MAHAHSHHGRHYLREGAEGRLFFGIILNALITFVQILGGLTANSLALLSDALHNFSDTLSLAISYFAVKVAKKDSSKQKTFGYKRAEIIAALINVVLLLVVGVLLFKEALTRLFEPEPVQGYIMLVVAAVGLLANLMTAILLHQDSKNSLNIKSVFLHIIADAVSSVAVLLCGGAILLWDAVWIDPLITILIAIYIIAHSMSLLRRTVDILMQTTPEHINIDALRARLCETPYVQDVHHIHIWQLDETNICFEAHIALTKEHLERMEIVKKQLRERLLRDFGIKHSTLEIEIFSGINDGCICDF